MADIRGSVGNQTFARNQGGFYVRARTSPAQPDTPAQLACRGVVTNLSQYWSTDLTAQQRADWRSYAHQHPRRDRFGLPHLVNGYTRFIRLNFHRFRHDLAVAFPDAPPRPPIYPPQTTFTAKANPDQVTISLAFPTYQGGVKFLNVFAFGGNNINPGRDFYNGPWRLLDDNRFTINWHEDPWIIAYPLDLVAGHKVFVKMVAQMYNTGEMSEPFQTSSVVSA